MAGNNRLLVVDDDREIANYIAKVARRNGYLAAVANTFDEFSAKIGTLDPSVILLDLQMPGADGIEFLNEMNEQKCRAKLVLISDADRRKLRTATQLGTLLGLDVRKPLTQPFSVYTLRRLLAKLVDSDESISPAELRRAIESGQIRPHYQPIVTMSGTPAGRVTGVEALARWYRNDTELLLPARFLGMIEEEGLMRFFTESMVYQVACQLKEWSKEGRELNGSINLSPSILTDRYVPDRLEEIVRNVGIDNRRRTFEATEDTVLDHTVETLEILSRLRIKGFGLSIDDFGTGYSSLQNLYEMPFNELKVDMSFTKACETSEEARIIVEATVELGHKLGLEVCAEGVENQGCFDYLHKIGCDRLQGYYVGKPRAPMDLFTTRPQQPRRIRYFDNNVATKALQPAM